MMLAIRKPSPWIIAAGAFALYLSAVTTPVDRALGADIILLPLSSALLMPALVYALLTLMFFPRVAVARRLAGVGLLCTVHALLSLMTAGLYSAIGLFPFHEALAQAFVGFPPAPFLQILLAPLMVLPFRKRFVPRQPHWSERLSAPLWEGPWIPSGPPADPPSSEPVKDFVLDPLTQEVRVKGPEMEEANQAPSWAEVARLPEPSPRPTIAREGTDAAVGASGRKGLSRPDVSRREKRASPPVAEKSSSPVERPASEDQEEPGFTRSLRASLEGTGRSPASDPVKKVIQIPFDRIAGQLPAEAFLIPADRLAARLPQPNVILVPQDLVVPQLPEGVVQIAWEVVAGQFPEGTLALPHEKIAEGIHGGMLRLPLDEVVRQLPAEIFTLPLRSAKVRGIEAFPLPFQPVLRDPSLSAAAPAASLDVPKRDPLRSGGLEHGGIQRLERPADASASISVQAERRAPEAHEEEPVRACTPATENDSPVRPVDLSQLTIETERLSALLAPIGSPKVDVEVTAGAMLFIVSSPLLAKEALVSTAIRLVPVLADSGDLGAIDQVTLRASGGAIILTPFFPHGAGGTVLVAGLRRRGSLAMLEILCRRAAAEYRDRHSDLLAPIETPVRERHRAPELRDVAVPGQVDLLVGSMSAFGPLTPSALCDGTGSTLLYLFSGPGVEANPLARLAWGLYHALTMDGPPDGLWPLRSIALRQGRQRIVIQPVAGEAGRSRLLVAAGAEAGHPGLAHLQVGRAAERIGSL